MRGTKLEIRLDALRHNAARARQLAGDADVCAMVKANGYGHGLIESARAFAPVVDVFGVAVLEEALALRAAGVVSPILLAEGFFDRAEMLAAKDANLEVVLHSLWQVDLLCATPLALPIWLKINTGMNRLGFSEVDAKQALAALQEVGVPIAGVMTHFACADDESPASAHAQWQQAVDFAQASTLPLSVCNSAGLLRFPECVAQRVRPGIMLYGSSPLTWQTAAEQALAVTQRFSARIIAINTVNAGESVGYGATWRAEKACRIGVVAVGYGDGYPRHAPNGTPVAVNERRTVLVGRVSMDMITIDLTDLDARVGDEVELWGDVVSVDEVAQHCGTISYELFCQVTARPERIYL